MHSSHRLPPRFPFRRGRFGTPGIGAHAVRPVDAPGGGALADFARLICTAVETARPDHPQQRLLAVPERRELGLGHISRIAILAVVAPENEPAEPAPQAA